MTCCKAKRRDAVMFADEVRAVANELEPSEVAAKVEHRHRMTSRDRMLTKSSDRSLAGLQARLINMKRTERHHLKDNELELLTRQAREAIEARKREVTAAIVVVAVIGVAALVYFVWHERVEARAHAMLADAMVVQDAKVVSPAAPSTATPQPAA